MWRSRSASRRPTWAWNPIPRVRRAIFTGSPSSRHGRWIDTPPGPGRRKCPRLEREPFWHRQPGNDHPGSGRSNPCARPGSNPTESSSSAPKAERQGGARERPMDRAHTHRGPSSYKLSCKHVDEHQPVLHLRARVRGPARIIPRGARMKIVIYGLTLTSSWGNGHATTYRSLAKALARKGHRIYFVEKDVEWYRINRDLPDPEFCTVRLYEEWTREARELVALAANADVVLIGSYFPDAIAATRALVNADYGPLLFYDIDTPITLSQLREQGR